MTVKSMILRGARVIDPANEVDAVMDIGIADGVFVPPEEVVDGEIVDLSGLVVAPGFVDMHVHLRDPGQTAKEDFASGSAAAAAGGFATIVAMPNTGPTIDSPELLADNLARAAAVGGVRILHTAALTEGLRGQKLTDAAALKAAGAVALTDDGTTIQSSRLMREALLAAVEAQIVVLDHCEDADLGGGGAIHAGRIAERLGVRGKPSSAEEVMIARNAVLAQETGCPVHLQHVSTATGIELVRMSRWAGWPVTCEVTPHHFSLTEDAVLEHGANAKMNPPLRREADRQAVLKGVCDGTVSVIATDHAPHTAAEKARALEKTPNGIVGLETAVALALRQLYHTGRLELPDLIAKFTVGPCVVLGLPYGTLNLGRPADVTILDLDRGWTIEVAKFKSKSRNCPYDGWPCRGKAVGTIVAGRWVYRDC